MSSYRSYVPWSKSNLGTSYTGSGSSYSGTPKTTDSTSAKAATSDSKYDAGYAGRRYGSTTSPSPSASGTGTGTGTSTSSYRPSSYTPTDRSASTTSKYGTSTSTDRTPAPNKYGTSTSASATSYLASKDKDKYSTTATTTSSPALTKDTKENDRPSIREKYNMGPALPASPPKTTGKETADKPSLRDKCKDDRQSLIDKYSSSTYPSRTADTPRSYSSGAADKKEEVPTTVYSRSLSRTATKTEPEPEKTSSYSTLSPYRLYGRTTSPYSRSTSRDESATSSAATTPTSTPTTNPTSLRYSRYSSTTASPRSPVNDRPTVTSPTPDKPRSGRTSRQEDEEVKMKEVVEVKPKEEAKIEVKVETKSVSVVTRGTSPTAPSTSSFLRTRRADLARVIEKTIERPVVRPEMVDKEIQSDRGDDTARLSRYGSTSRSTVSPWSSYLDRFPSTGSGYSPTVAKYSTRSSDRYGSGYGSTPRGEREATVTTSSPTPVETTPAVAEAPKAIVSTRKAVKEEEKEVVKPPDPVDPLPLKAKIEKPEESVVGSKRDDDLSLSRAKTKTEVSGLKRTPSFTRVADVVLKRVPSSVSKSEEKKTDGVTKADDNKKPPAAKKIEGIDKDPVELKLDADKKTVSKKIEGTTEIKKDEKKAPVIKKVIGSDEKPMTEIILDDKKLGAKKLEENVKTTTESKPKGLSKSPSVTKLDETKIARALTSATVKTEDQKKTPPSTNKEENSLPKPKSDEGSEAVKKTSSTAKVTEPIVEVKSQPKEIQSSDTNVKPSDDNIKKDDIDVLKGALAGLIRANTEKPPINKSITKADSLSESESESMKSKSSPSPTSSKSEKVPLKKLITKNDSLSESESENLKLKSPSSPSLSESDKLRTPPLSPPPTLAASLAKLGSPSTNRKFLPPPVPKGDGKTSPSQHSLNKDFRKSALNMDASSSDAEELKKLNEKQRLTSKVAKKTKRSASASSDDASESSEAHTSRGGSAPAQNPPETKPTLQPSKSSSSSKLMPTSSSTKLDALQVPGRKQLTPERKSRSPSIHKSASSSEETESSEESTSESSSDDEAEETPSRSSASNMLQPSKSPSILDKNKSLFSTSSSKCLNTVSSADESSLADKPPRPPSSPKPPQKEEAKSFLMRALAPVTNYFKSKTHEAGVDSSSENLSELPRSESTQSLAKSIGSDKEDSKKSESDQKKPHKIRHIESGERAWWLDSSENIPEGVQRIKSSKSISKMSSDSEPDSKKKERGVRKNKIRHIESGERAWWLDSADSIPENSESVSEPKRSSGSETDSKKKKERSMRKNKIRHIESGERAWWLDNNDSIPEDSESISVPKLELNSEKVSDPDVMIVGRKIRKQESGERAWWLDSNSNIPEGIERMKSNTSINRLASESDQEAMKQENDTKLKINRIRKQESGERAWWLDSNSNIPEGVQRIQSSSSIAKAKEPSPVAETSSKKFPIRHQQSGEKAWWMNSSSSDIAGGVKKAKSKAALHGAVQKEKASSKQSDSSDESEESDGSESENTKNKGAAPKFPQETPSGAESTNRIEDRTGRSSPYDNVLDKAPIRIHKKRPKNRPLFISNHTNIDDILGTAASLVDPVMGASRRLQPKEEEPSEDDEHENCEEVEATQVRIHDSTAKQPTIRRIRDESETARRRQSLDKLDDTALQLYKDGDYGSYLDLEASISEQQEEFDGFQANRKNSIVLRTQLSVRVHTIIEKLLNSEGRELRRALFSLKQIFQEDKDLVHEFVQNDGLACLIKVGSEADQNYQNYILRALGQVMLYVDGMNGVMDHNRTVQWLYTLIASKFRLVVKTALKLLLVFVEYVDTNCMLLIKAVNAVDTSQGLPPWSNVMRLVKDYDSADTELLTYATTLLNKTLNGVPDQDTYYDQVDALEEQGVEGAIQRYMSKQGTDLDLLRQFQIYEAVLHHEDGEEKGTPLKQLDEAIRKTLRNRQSPAASLTLERRKSRRHSTGASPLSTSLNNSRLKNATTPNNNNHHHHHHHNNNNNNNINHDGDGDGDDTGSSSSRSSPGPGEVPHLNGSYKDKQTGDAGVTPALKRRRERAERQRSFIREQQETSANLRATRGVSQEGADDENELSQRLNGSHDGSNKLNRVSSRKDLTPLMNAVNKMDSAENESKSPESNNGLSKKPWSRYSKNGEEVIDGEDINTEEDPSGRKLLLNVKRENTVKDLTQKLASQNILNSPTEEKVISRIGDMSGLISKAKEGLAKSKSKVELLKSASGDALKMVEVKKSETELHWEELVSGMSRPLELCDLDFTDLKSDDELDILSPALIANGIPPPPPPAPMPPMMPKDGPPPPPPNRLGSFVPPPCPTTPTSFGVNLRHQRSSATSPEKSSPQTPQTPTSKTKKTVKLFWKEVRDDPMMQRLQQKTGMIWDELNHVTIDTQKLEHLFESRAKDLITKEKQQEMNKTKEIIVLDHKRSNAINIGMTKLPPPRSIKTAILKMDATIMTREGIEKLLTMLPTEDEQSKIQEAQLASPEMPLGSAEQFLLTLASISELSARLKLWAFKLDYENSEKEIAEPLMDLKQGVETLRSNKTFRGILSTLLSIGIFLNGNEVKGFQIEYLAKVPEVKDTVHKHSLLHHLCHMVMEKFPDATDLYSEIGAVTRASKVDFDELSTNIQKMEQECKASWDHLKDIAKHDGSTIMKVKMTDFLADCAERIIVLGIVHRRVMNRYHKFLLWLGIPFFRVSDMKPSEFCRIVSEFALEYRTTRERVLLQLEKKANHRERNKTRGKMITEVGKFRTKEDRADAELRQLLGTHTHGTSDLSDAESVVHGATLPWRRQRKDVGRTVLGPLIRDETINGNVTDGDDEILESLVKTATKAPGTRTMPRERKRTRHADRKSLKRSRTRENNVGGEGSASP